LAAGSEDATVKRYFYQTHDQLRAHLRDFVDAYIFARRLKTLRDLTPYEFICNAWTSQLWAKFYTEAPRRQRRSVERYSIVKRA
jgi:hypothetical protein